MGLFDFFKRNRGTKRNDDSNADMHNLDERRKTLMANMEDVQIEFDNSSHSDEASNEFKYRIEIGFFKSETPDKEINKKAELCAEIIRNQMTVLEAELEIKQDPDDEDVATAIIEFTGLAQFRFEDEEQTNQELENSFPLISSNMGVGFWMKGGAFSEIAEVLFAETPESELPISTDITFYNSELDKDYDVTLEKDHIGPRMSGWF